MCEKEYVEIIKTMELEIEKLLEHNKLLQLENERLMSLEIEISRALLESSVSCWKESK